MKKTASSCLFLLFAIPLVQAIPYLIVEPLERFYEMVTGTSIMLNPMTVLIHSITATVIFFCVYTLWSIVALIVTWRPLYKLVVNMLGFFIALLTTIGFIAIVAFRVTHPGESQAMMERLSYWLWYEEDALPGLTAVLVIIVFAIAINGYWPGIFRAVRRGWEEFDLVLVDWHRNFNLVSFWSWITVIASTVWIFFNLFGWYTNQGYQQYHAAETIVHRMTSSVTKHFVSFEERQEIVKDNCVFWTANVDIGGSMTPVKVLTTSFTFAGQSINCPWWGDMEITEYSSTITYTTSLTPDQVIKDACLLRGAHYGLEYQAADIWFDGLDIDCNLFLDSSRLREFVGEAPKDTEYRYVEDPAPGKDYILLKFTAGCAIFYRYDLEQHRYTPFECRPIGFLVEILDFPDHYLITDTGQEVVIPDSSLYEPVIVPNLNEITT